MEKRDSFCRQTQPAATSCPAQVSPAFVVTVVSADHRLFMTTRKNTFACRHFYRSCEFANHPFAAGESQVAGLSRSGLCSLHNGAGLDASPGTRTGRSFRNAQHDAASTFQSAAPL